MSKKEKKQGLFKREPVQQAKDIAYISRFASSERTMKHKAMTPALLFDNGHLTFIYQHHVGVGWSPADLSDYAKFGNAEVIMVDVEWTCTITDERVVWDENNRPVLKDEE